MIAAGEVPMVDCAVFADTQGEPKAVYAWLDWLEKQVPYPVHRVTRGNLWAAATHVRTTRDGLRQYTNTSLPVYTSRDDDAEKGLARRQCTRTFKIDPITSVLRKLLGRRAIRKSEGVLVEVLIGISLDEVIRMKPSRKPWISNSWPLIGKGMNRADCQAWFDRNDFPQPPRSACVYCPFHSDDEWLRLTPAEFQEACDKEIELQATFRSVPGLAHKVPYFHAKRIPLSQVKLIPGSKEKDQMGLFGNECEGMCGV
jgi:hypothetical protein